MKPEPPFTPTREAALARLAAVRPADYARTRNALDGAVTRLSPYLTHGLLGLPEVLADVDARRPLDIQHKFVYELGWRAYFRHVWRHRGDGILRSLHEGPLPDRAYATELPDDIRQGRTGVPAIDQAVATLYRTGYLHNHARMWLASYVVHLRKVHWRAGADWLYGHLLDGDLASNHLSWQWVAGTGSSKPYLFNAENVARYAPADWHSPGTDIDTSYEALDRIARTPPDARPAPRRGTAPDRAGIEPALTAGPPPADGLGAPDASTVAGRDVWLVHPWSLGNPPTDLPADALVLGVFVADGHRRHPWNALRWRFVGDRMAELASHRWHGDAAAIGAALKSARRVRTLHDPHLGEWLPRWADCAPAPALFPPIDRRCDSFSRWWNQATRGLTSAADLLNHTTQAGW